MPDSVEYEADGHLVTVWLNRPRSKNAYDLELLRALDGAISRAEADPASRVVVIRGRGDSFCAGADVSMLAGDTPWSELADSVARTFKRISESRRITIAAVHGWTVAGGFELMLACDFALASEDARIGDFHIRHGLFAGAGTIYRLPRLIGLRKARELMLSGDVIDGREAKGWGLVNDAAPLVQLDALIERFASRFSERSPTVAWLTKLAVNRGLDADYETLSALERLTSDAVAATDDARAGVAAFLERHRD
ncbi:MAG: enoyl-CoA hydratase/isomerase family protein [Solirubrobacteraceae bacterium]